MTRCDSLDMQHPALQESAEARTTAANALFDVALSCSNRFGLQFDRARLRHALGESSFAALLPDLPADAPRKHSLDEYDDALDGDRAQLLRRVLSFGDEGWTDTPLNHIDQVALYSPHGDMVLRATDGGEFILFALPPDERAQLLERYAAAGIPRDVIETVDVDIADGFHTRTHGGSSA